MNATEKKGRTIEHEPGQAIAASSGGQLTPVDLMNRAIDKGLDPETLEKFMDLHERHEKTEARKAFHKAMSRFAAICPPIPKTGRAKITSQTGGSYQYDYPKLEVMQKTIKTALEECGLSYYWTAAAVSPEGVLSLECVISHEMGHSESTPFSIPIDKKMKVNDSQQFGSAASYAKRYSLGLALPLILEGIDDDAHAGGEAKTISIEQASALKKRLQVIDADEGAFCAFLGVGKLVEIPAGAWSAANNALKAKERKAKAGGSGDE